VKYKYTTQTNALKIAREIMQEQGIKKPVLAFVEKSAWESMKNKDDVASINVDDNVSLDYFMDKSVVYCMYQKRSVNITEVLAKQWYDFLGGDSITIAIGDFRYVK